MVSKKSVDNVKSLPRDMLETGIAFGFGAMTLGVMREAGVGPTGMRIGSGLIGAALIADTGKKIEKRL